MCIGFGEEYAKCEKPRDPKSAYWCQACELARRAHISAQFKKLKANLDAAGVLDA